MDELGNVTLSIGRLEDKFTLYEPILRDLQGLASIPDDINKLQDALQALRESRIATEGKLSGLLENSDKAYADIAKMLQDRSRALETEIKNCPVLEIERALGVLKSTVDTLKHGLDEAEKAIDSFKRKGWDIIIQFIPWFIATCATVWAIFKP
jgi:chromosome segregation ATPase